MNIEAGKAYLMRCVGSVRIDRVDDDYAYSGYDVWDRRSGKRYINGSSLLDLIKEVPFAYGEMVVSNEGYIGYVLFIYGDNRAFIKWRDHSFGSVTTSNIKLHDKKELIAEIEAKIAELQEKLQQLTGR